MKFKVIFFIIFFLHSCAFLKEAVQVKEPIVKSENLRISSLSFEEIELEFDLIIENPNAVSLTFSKLEYNVNIESQSFINGKVDKKFDIVALDKSKIIIPVKLIYKNILSTFSDLLNKDEISYEIKCQAFLYLPIINDIKIPISVSGKIPLPKFPKLEIVSLEKSNLNLLGVDLTLKVKMKNPNFFNLKITDFAYNFILNNSEILNGKNPIDLKAKSESIIPFKVRLNFIQLGEALLNILRGGGQVNYNFESTMILEGELAKLWKKRHEIKLNGVVNIK
jgi:LEA14-like dessication related protein